MLEEVAVLGEMLIAKQLAMRVIDRSDHPLSRCQLAAGKVPVEVPYKPRPSQVRRKTLFAANVLQAQDSYVALRLVHFVVPKLAKISSSTTQPALRASRVGRLISTTFQNSLCQVARSCIQMHLHQRPAADKQRVSKSATAFELAQMSEYTALIVRKFSLGRRRQREILRCLFRLGHGCLLAWKQGERNPLREEQRRPELD